MNSNQSYDSITGEIVEDAADGRPAVPMVSNHFSTLIRVLEDGDFDIAAAGALRELVSQIRDVAILNGGKAKGSITIKLDVALEGGMASVMPKLTIKAPEMPRMKTPMWPLEDGRLSPTPPGQKVLFGSKQAGPSGGFKTV